MAKKHDRFHRHVPASRALVFVDRDRLQQLLGSLIPTAPERDFLMRCLIDEGPIHHRGSNYLLLMLLGQVLSALPGRDRPLEGEEVPMRLPPHLEEEVQEGNFPLKLPTVALRRLLGPEEGHLAAALDCLTDGPPQHALANVAVVALLERILQRLEVPD